MGDLEPGPANRTSIVVLISADAEWRAVRSLFPAASRETTPFGEWFRTMLPGSHPVLFFHSGWGKIAAAASTQYAIDRWKPALLVNLGTCGGIEGEIERGAIVLAERTLVYDIQEQMGDLEEHTAHYTTEIDLSWLGEPYPQPVVRGLLVSADRDLPPAEVLFLKERYGAVAGDWESGAIAWTAARNNIPCLILRGVTDLVSETGGDAYGDLEFFNRSAQDVMVELTKQLPGWISCWRGAFTQVS